MISKKLIRSLNKLIKPTEPCIGCFGTKKHHSNYSTGRVDNFKCHYCNNQKINIYRGENGYNRLFTLYTKNCKCPYHFTFDGYLIDKQKIN